LVVRKLFRTMKADDAGRPVAENSKRGLGVVAPDDIPTEERETRAPDVVPDRDEIVHPGKGGMSVTPDDPRKMSLARRPIRLGGRSKDPLFAIRSDSLAPELSFRPDPRAVDRHGFVEPSSAVTLARFRLDLAATAPRWWMPK
jgi:hypothetical protein